MHIPKTLTEAVRYYADEQACIDTVAAMRWQEGYVICPKCGVAESKQRKHYWLATQKRWKCYACRKQFSVKVDSVFEDSPLGLDIWLIAMWMLVNCKNGVSSHEIARETGISQKAAWHLLHRIRYALAGEPLEPLGGPGSVVEADEAYIGGNAKNKHGYGKTKRSKFIKDAATGRCIPNPDWATNRGRGTEKVAVMGMLDREAREVRAKVIPSVDRKILQDMILENVTKGSSIYTDSFGSYNNLKALDFVHETVNHAVEYVRGEVHTNSLENFWSTLKRSLRGTYIATEPFHLDKYIGEQVFRYNNRATEDNPLTNSDRFALALSMIAGKRLTWRTLTGKEEGSPA